MSSNLDGNVTDTSLLARIPGDEPLYIGSLYALSRASDLKAANITHVLTVFRPPIDVATFEGYIHKLIPVDDVDDENILEQIPSANEFIRAGLASGGAILVHCVMGRSRSAAFLAAYLMHTHTIPLQTALSRIKSVRPSIEPNAGFIAQLELYHSLGCPDDMESCPGYQRWLYRRQVELATEAGMAPETIRFEDEQTATRESEAEVQYKCRKCRRQLATSTYVVPHEGNGCAHYFLDALSWMRPELEKGMIEGRLECPNGKCGSNVGKYAWQGMRCSCGAWVVPGISLAKSRIDEVRNQVFGIRDRTTKDKGNL